MSNPAPPNGKGNGQKGPGGRPLSPITQKLADVAGVKLEKIQIEKITDFPVKFQQQLQDLMGSMKRNFAEQLEKLQKDFVEGQQAEILKVYKTINDNQQKIAAWNKTKTDALEKVRADLFAEKREWEETKAKLDKVSNKDSKLIKLNIGGTHEIEASTAILTSDKDSFLTTFFTKDDMFKPLIKEDGSLFLDRDGESFCHLVEYLRNAKKTEPEFRGLRERKMFFKELEFWKIEPRHFFDKPAERYYYNKQMEQNRKLITYDNKGKPVYHDGTMDENTMESERDYLQNLHEQFARTPNKSVVDKRLYSNSGMFDDQESVNKKYGYTGGMRQSPRTNRLRSSRNSLNIFPDHAGGLKGNRFGLPDIQKSKAEKEIELSELMKTLPKKKQGSAYQFSEDLKMKWKQLGPFSLQHIDQFTQEWANSEPAKQSDTKMEKVDYDNLELGKSKAVPQIIAQLDDKGVAQGVGKKISPYSLFEGQFKNNKRHGYGRVIYSSYYYVGQWENDRQHGWGKQVDMKGKVLEGLWDRNNFLGEMDQF